MQKKFSSDDLLISPIRHLFAAAKEGRVVLVLFLKSEMETETTQNAPELARALATARSEVKDQ